MLEAGVKPVYVFDGQPPSMKSVELEKRKERRAAAEKKFGGRCAITTAVPGMLEFLPLGASKGAAVAKLLKRLDIDPANVLALGDGENDVEMLRLAGTSVAMGGSSALVACAAFIIEQTNASRAHCLVRLSRVRMGRSFMM